MIEVKFQSVVDSLWTEMVPIPIGYVPTGLGTPDIYVLVTEDERPLYRLDLYCDIGAHVFEEAIVWQGLVVIGYGEKLHFRPSCKL
jgi:hypothetical protein